VNTRVERARINVRHAMARASRCGHVGSTAQGPCPACLRGVAVFKQQLNAAWRDAHQERRQEAPVG
jgi:hypothetical protein